MSQVWFFDYSKGSAVEGIPAILEKSGFKNLIPKDGRVAIKLHMGEMGNTRYLRPLFARNAVDFIKSNGGTPFLFDTITNYVSQRNTKAKYRRTAAMNGFARATVKAPIFIYNDSDEYQTVSIKCLEGCKLKYVKIPSLLLGADCIFVLSHVKGHGLTGLGGAIKNLGMGCVSTETKRAQHSIHRLQFVESTCDSCGICVDTCPTDALAMVDGKPVREDSDCISCGACEINCPTKSWVLPPGSKELIQVYIAHAASAVLSGYKGKFSFMNVIQDVVPFCDCVPLSGKPFVQDVGIVFSFDPVAVDKASGDLVDHSPIIPGTTEHSPPDLLGKVAQTDSSIQLKTAEKLGMGTLKYEMVSL